MKKLLIGAFLALGAWAVAPESSYAQSTLSVNIKTARLAWKWEQGSGGPADGFNVLCGQSSGNYTKKTVISATARSTSVLHAIDGYGTWFCAVEAFNDTGVSGRTNEVTFRASDIPVDPTDLSIETDPNAL
jgi:hypothetical protein